MFVCVQEAGVTTRLLGDTGACVGTFINLLGDIWERNFRYPAISAELL